ncbi:unnamed protein product [Bursaphelenchus xylophilus]|uniref:(pine wood nematode) hypothetical protein n=1 Tax=Bursaphelenchus xylophilus TaxID=6326 RepID=A0A1I7SMW7_BURXY|nr:unnamed protein product [Bursaphelenchus xylophilus]CAG9100395.1 unnamed protein product [Bursaphelenchus xylophilus]
MPVTVTVCFLQLPILGPILRVSFYVFYEMNVYVTVCRFLFRYAQTTGKTSLLGILSSKRFFILLFIFFLILCIKAAWLSINTYADGIEFKRNFPNNNPALKKYIMDHTIVIARTTIFDQLFLYVVFPSTLLIGSFCTYRCYRFKRKATVFLSQRTIHMYRVLIMGLVIEQLAEFLWILVPMLVVHLALEGRQRPLGFFVMFRLFYSYNTFVLVFTLSIYRRYREAVRELFSQIFGVQKTPIEVVGTSTL